MPCVPFQTPDGLRGIACLGKRGRRKCSACKTRWADLACDFPAPNRKSGTCDKALCTKCAVHVGEDLDHCPSHPRGTPSCPAQGALQL